MRIKKENLSNFVFIIILALLLFTPVGFHARVFVSRIFSFSPTELDKDEQAILSTYNWHLSDLNREVFYFENTKGEVVLVNLWATWCPPCVAEMPNLQELYNDYGNEVAFVFVAHDEQQKVKDFLSEKNYELPVYFEKSISPDALSAESIPTTFIIDRNGKIIVQKVGAADWNSENTRKLLDKLLKE